MPPYAGSRGTLNMFKNKVSIAVAIVLVASFLMPDLVSAASLSQAGVRLGRLGIGATSGNDVLVTFKLNTTPTSVAKVTLTFPAGFTITSGSPTPSTSGFPDTPSITAAPGSLTSTATGGGAGAGGTIVVSGLTSASLNNTTLYGFSIPSGTVQNPATAGEYSVAVESDTSGGSPIDSTSTSVDIFGASANQDQVTVNGSVAPNFTFSLSGNTDTVPKVDPSATQTSTGVTMSVATNSALGYTAYVKSANGEMTSASNPGTPITTGTFDGSPDSVSPGTTDYGFVPSTGTPCSSCTGTLTYDGEYAVSDGTHAGSFNGTNFASFVSRNGDTSGDQVLLQERVDVSSSIGYASDYTDTLTIVAAGNF